MTRKAIFFIFALQFLFVSVSYAKLSEEYGRHLGKIVDDVVKSIHATVPNSLITHADVLAIMCVEQRSLVISKNSPVGARGLTQVMPYTFNDYVRRNIDGFGDFARRTSCTASVLSSDPRCSIEAGARIFNTLLKKYKGDRNMAAGAYHGGEGSVISKYSYKGAMTTRYAMELYPSCFNKLKNGQAPESNKVWRALVQTVANITDKSFGLKGVLAEFVAYTAGSDSFAQAYLSQQAENKNPLFGSLTSQFKSWFGSGSGVSQSSSYDPYSAGYASSNGITYSGPSQQVTSTEDFFYTSQDFDANRESSRLVTAEETTNNIYKQPEIQTTDGFLYCLPKKLQQNEPFLLAYSCPNSYQFKESNFGTDDESGVLVQSFVSDKEFVFSCVKDKRQINYKCSVTSVNSI